MVEPAGLFEEQLKGLKPVDGESMYWIYVPFEPARLKFVSTRDGVVIGQISLIINTAADSVIDFSIKSFTDKYRVSFAKDCMMFTRFLMWKHRKMQFMVLAGHPSGKTYDRLARRNGWRLSAYMRDHVKNEAGKWADIKMYEYINPNRRENAAE